MTMKLCWGALAMMLVNLNSAYQTENDVKALYGNNYMVPPATNQQQEHLGLPQAIQSGNSERYDTNNYVPSFKGQEQFQQFGTQNLKDRLSQGGVRQSTYNQFSGQNGLPPPVPPKSSSAYYNQGSLKLPENNGLPGQEVLRPPVPPSSNVFYRQDSPKLPGSKVPPPFPQDSNAMYGQDAVPPPGSNQLPIQGDVPPPVPPNSNTLYQQDSFKLPVLNQLSGTEELPPQILPGSNTFYGQNNLQPPGSNQLHGAEDIPRPVPPSLNVLYGQDTLRLPSDSQVPGGDLPPPFLPSLNAYNDQTAFKLPENNQVYELDSHPPPVGPSIKIPYGNDVVAPSPNNNQFGQGGWQPPVLPELKVPYGEDALVPLASNTLSEDKFPKVVSNTDNGLKSPSKSTVDGTSNGIIQDSGFEDDSFDEDFNQEDSNFGSEGSFDASYYSSLLKGLGDLGADYANSESEGSSYELSIGSWNTGSDYDNIPLNQGTVWEPSGTGNAEQKETGLLYPPKTRLRPVGSTSREDNTPIPTSLSVYCIPVALLILLVYLIRSNSYFRRTPKVIIIDPESRNRDIDAKAKEIEPLLRESMEYKDEVN